MFIKVKPTEIMGASFPVFGKFEFADSSAKVIVILENLPVLGLDSDQDLVDIP